MQATIKEKLMKLDSASLSDALDSMNIEGCLFGIHPLAPGRKIAGKAFTVKYGNYEEEVAEFKNAGNYVDDVASGSVIVIDNAGREDCTVWGDILTNISLSKGVIGTVVHGAVRDVKTIKALDYPVFSRSFYMRSGKNRVRKIAQQEGITIGLVRIRPDDYIFGDDNGVLAIPAEASNEIVVRAENICRSEERILLAVQAGCSLKNAREKYRYDQPWLGEKI